jgi:glycosyltransferase involved in cell wall biosynthesis
VESYGAGVAQALNSFVRALPEVEHHLMCRVRAGEYLPSGEWRSFATVHEVSGGPLRALVALRRSVATTRPDIIHAHSSYAGGLVRMAVRRGHTPIVYSPHCFAFERGDLPRSIRNLLWVFERVLARNTSALALCSTREVMLARRLSARCPARLVPNVAAVEGLVPRVGGEHHPTVVAVGRIGAQKDPAFFGAVVNDLRRLVPNMKATWIGDGDAHGRSFLAAAGVEVTGWRPRTAAQLAIRDADLVLHVARWEGFPMVIVEAHALGVPVVVRDIPPFHDVPAGVRSARPEQLAVLAAEVLNDEGTRAENIAAWSTYLSRNTVSCQGEVLRDVYEQARG